MADETLVLTCRVADYDAGTGVCAAPFYSGPSSFLPELSIADAESIAYAFLAAVCAVMVVKLIGKKAQ